MPALRLAHRMTDGDGLGRGPVDAPLLHFGACARGLAGRGDRAVLDADLAADPLHPFPRRHFLDDRLKAANVDGGQRTRHEVANGDRGHLRLRIGPAHHVRIDHRTLQVRRRHQRLDRIATADLQRHDPAEAISRVALHQVHSPRDGAAVGEALLPDQRRTHVGNRGDPVVVGQLGRRHELDPVAFLVERPHVEQAEIGAAAAAGAEHPGADGQRFDVVDCDVGQGHDPVLRARSLLSGWTRVRRSEALQDRDHRPASFVAR